MKITKTIKGWEAFKLTRSEIKRWLINVIKSEIFTEEKRAMNMCSSNKMCLTKPKQCKITITYELED